MSHLLSSGLLAASMFLGQTGEPTPNAGKSAAPAPPTIQSTQPTPPAQRPILNWFNREDRPIMNKIQGWFKRDSADAKPGPYIQPTRTGGTRETTAPPLASPEKATPASNDFPRKLPNPSSKAKSTTSPLVKDAPASEVNQASLAQINATKSAKNPILPQWANKVGRDEKFDWITGQIEIENGSHVIYYASPETIDKFNGRIVLQPQQVDMSQFRRGDLVSVRGQVVQRQALQGSSASYRITVASLIERPKS